MVNHCEYTCIYSSIIVSLVIVASGVWCMFCLIASSLGIVCGQGLFVCGTLITKYAAVGVHCSSTYCSDRFVLCDAYRSPKGDLAGTLAECGSVSVCEHRTRHLLYCIDGVSVCVCV